MRGEGEKNNLWIITDTRGKRLLLKGDERNFSVLDDFYSFWLRSLATFGCPPDPEVHKILLYPDIKSFFPAWEILRRNCN